MSLEIKKKLAIVGATGLVFAGGIVGLSSLASAQSPTVNDDTDSATSQESAPTEEFGEELREELSEELGFDGFSEEDQGLILGFEECLNEAGLDPDSELTDNDYDLELTEEDFEKIDAAFAECEPILEDLSFDADNWLEPGDLSEEDQSVLDEFENCLSEIDELEFEPEAGTADEDFAELDEAFEACDAILEDLSEDADFIVDCEEGEFEDHEFEDHDEDVESNDDIDGELVESILEA